MRKRLLLLFILFFCLGCTKKEVHVEIRSDILEEESYIIGINYPVIGVSKFDRKISKFIERTKKLFINQYENVSTDLGKAELNIDYQISFVNKRYVNVIFTIFINSPHLAHPETKVMTFVYDLDKRYFMKLSDLIDYSVFKDKVTKIQATFIENYKECILMDSMKTILTEDMNNYPFFTFTDTDFTIYFNPYTITAGYCNIISSTFSFDHFRPKINLEKEEYVFEEAVYNPVFRLLDPNSKIVSITFDDGPSKYTDSILDLLESSKDVATFFVLGNRLANHKETLKRMVSLGNEIGNHTYNHRSMYQLSTKGLLDQVEQTQSLIKEITGYVPRYFRPTYGTVTKRIKKNVPLELSLWDIDTKDWKNNKTIDSIVEETLVKIEDGSVVLMHDTHSKTVKVIEKLLPRLEEKGYKLVTLSERDDILRLRKNGL